MPPRHPDDANPQPEVILVDRKRVACDGGGVLGHPLVYLEMGDNDWAECGYCDRRFELASGPGREDEYHDPAARAPEAH
ncbi:zinc-finger domain-containing protein [Brevundimonas sp. 2R-24]|uniref:Zinc-finger domain-containing protein n=1 Tax=Peiella sedimenti TaxID=3061083 RepID=A0ABT8SH92_9CAUL|nr:zinc-finger domain-containing protein [Caulobacteraceae bacterium XZ-24]